MLLIMITMAFTRLRPCVLAVFHNFGKEPKKSIKRITIGYRQQINQVLHAFQLHFSIPKLCYNTKRNNENNCQF